MVDKPMTFSMNDLVNKFENVNLLCTLVCAGNRRKEQNMVKKTKGFNWGASGTGTGQSDALLYSVLIMHCTQHLAAVLMLAPGSIVLCSVDCLLLL